MDRILIIDDDVEMCGMLGDYLRSEGLEPEIVHEGNFGLERALSGEHALIVLDVMLPDLNGLELLRRLRSASSVRVILLTGRSELIDRIVGLEIGADDYLAKPFSARELLARIRAILRRPLADCHVGRAVSRTMPILLGDVEMDFGTRTVLCGGKLISLTAVEFKLLELLLRSEGYVVTRDQVADIVLGRNLAAFDRTIDVHISKLRRKLGKTRSGQERIRSIRSVGYLYSRESSEAEKS